MKYWIVKFAPFRVNWQHILATGKFEIYSVRSPQSRNNLLAMKKGDKAFFYHSQKEMRIMGIMEVIQEAHQDYTTKDERWKSVTFEPIETLESPILISTLRSIIALKNITFLRQPRVAVSEITKDEFNIIKNINTDRI